MKKREIAIKIAENAYPTNLTFINSVRGNGNLIPFTSRIKCPFLSFANNLILSYLN
jgi:hypothetical protein